MFSLFEELLNCFPDLKPKIALSFLPGLPAYVTVMCVRYTDLFNHEERAKWFINSILQAIKRLIQVTLVQIYHIYYHQF